MTPFQEGKSLRKEALKGFISWWERSRDLCEIAEGLWGLAGTVPGSRRAAEWGSDGVGLGEGIRSPLPGSASAFSPGPRNSYLRSCFLRSPLHGLWQPCPLNRLWSRLHPTRSHWPLDTWNRMIFDRQADLVQPRLSRGPQRSPNAHQQILGPDHHLFWDSVQPTLSLISIAHQAGWGCLQSAGCLAGVKARQGKGDQRPDETVLGRGFGGPVAETLLSNAGSGN